MNQLGSTDLYLGRPAVLFDCASRIERQLSSISIQTSDFSCAEPNAYVTCKLYKLYLSQKVCAFHRLGLCAKDFILNKMAGKEECACSSCFETTEYSCLRCERLKKKESILDVHMHFKPTETFQYRLYQSRGLKTSQNKIFKNNI